MIEQVHELHKKVITVDRLIREPNLAVPIYQRPYKWTPANVNQLYSDISAHRDKQAYRLGTVVFHRDGETLNLVDGQQRTITLLLTAHALIEHRLTKIKRQDLRDDLETLRPVLQATMERFTFAADISWTNLRDNHSEICRLISRPEFSDEHIHYLLHHCELVTFVLEDISEAFQFFDSQNARGRDLEPHDLLKAYHLREFNEADESLKATTVARWEDTNSEQLAKVFANYLFRIRRWSRGCSARYFGKEDTSVFKGVNLASTAPYPYTNGLRIIHSFVDHHRSQFEREIDLQHFDYPFQLDQTIINGRRFFEMIGHYLERIEALRRKVHLLAERDPLGERAQEILNTLDTYEGRHRRGDQYVRTVFDCLLIYYMDKFGTAELTQAIEKIFIWSYALRLKRTAVQLASVDNHVLESDNFFIRIRESVHPREFIHLRLAVLPAEDVKSNSPEAIRKLFSAMGYFKV
jgi:hypothetical protein